MTDDEVAAARLMAASDFYFSHAGCFFSAPAANGSAQIITPQSAAS
jgi:hypothetical protein